MATTIYSGTEDGYVTDNGGVWPIIRNAGTGTHSHTSTAYPYAVRASVSSGRGGSTYFITRAFFTFQVNGIINIPKISISNSSITILKAGGGELTPTSY